MIKKQLRILTLYETGSLPELWAIAWPMILTSAASYVMIFMDRVILANYSSDCLNASVAALPWYWAFHSSMLSLAAIAQVFVGQYNGAKQYKKVGEVVWQLLWFSFSCWIILLPLAIFGTNLLLAKEFKVLGAPYLKILFFFSPFSLAAFGALSSFFIGHGRTGIVTFVIIITNVLNLILVICLVFGVWIFPEMGIRGAAVATGVSQVFAFCIFFIIFLTPQHQEKYHTNNYKIVIPVFKKCLKIGIPVAMSCFLNCAGWALFWQMLGTIGKEDYTALGIGYSIYICFAFTCEGIGKSVNTISANIIGAEQYQSIEKLFKTAIKLQVIFSVIVFIPTVVYSDILVSTFFYRNLIDANNIALLGLIRQILFWAWVFYTAEALFWILMNILNAAGDTRFTMSLNITSFWILFMLPSYLFIIKLKGNPILCWQFLILYVSFSSLVFFLRFKQGKRQSLQPKKKGIILDFQG